MKLNSTGNKITLFLTNDEIDQQTQAKIRSQYSESDEYKLHRLSIEALATGQPIPEEYLTYQNFVKTCVDEGKARKTL